MSYTIVLTIPSTLTFSLCTTFEQRKIRSEGLNFQDFDLMAVVFFWYHTITVGCIGLNFTFRLKHVSVQGRIFCWNARQSNITCCGAHSLVHLRDGGFPQVRWDSFNSICGGFSLGFSRSLNSTADTAKNNLCCIFSLMPLSRSNSSDTGGAALSSTTALFTQVNYTLFWRCEELTVWTDIGEL